MIMLVRNGFSLSDIREMTIDQINLYIMACFRAEKRSTWNNVISTLAGSRYDENGLNKLKRELE